jgi:hypothetical protein
MATKTVVIGDKVKLEYFGKERLYLVMAIHPETGVEVPLFNLSDDRALAIAEIEFDGYLDPIFYELDEHLIALNDKQD